MSASRAKSTTIAKFATTLLHTAVALDAAANPEKHPRLSLMLAEVPEVMQCCEERAKQLVTDLRGNREQGTGGTIDRSWAVDSGKITVLRNLELQKKDRRYPPSNTCLKILELPLPLLPLLIIAIRDPFASLKTWPLASSRSG